MASGSSLTDTGVIGCAAEGDGSAPKWTSVVDDGDTDVEIMSSERSSRKGDSCDDGESGGYGDATGRSFGKSVARCSGVDEEEEDPV